MRCLLRCHAAIVATQVIHSSGPATWTVFTPALPFTYTRVTFPGEPQTLVLHTSSIHVAFCDYSEQFCCTDILLIIGYVLPDGLCLLYLAYYGYLPHTLLRCSICTFPRFTTPHTHTLLTLLPVLGCYISGDSCVIFTHSLYFDLDVVHYWLHYMPFCPRVTPQPDDFGGHTYLPTGPPFIGRMDCRPTHRFPILRDHCGTFAHVP